LNNFGCVYPELTERTGYLGPTDVIIRADCNCCSCYNFRFVFILARGF